MTVSCQKKKSSVGNKSKKKKKKIGLGAARVIFFTAWEGGGGLSE